MLIDGTLSKLTATGDFHVTGDVIAYSSTPSDERLKDNINKIENAVDKIKQIDGVEYNYIVGDKPSAGVIAQQVEKVLPSAVKKKSTSLHKEIEGDYLTVDYDQLSALFIEAIKELKAENEELRALIVDLGE